MTGFFMINEAQVPITAKLVEVSVESRTIVRPRPSRGILNALFDMGKETSMPAVNGKWLDYDKLVLDEAKKSGQKVFVHYTADWCLICKVQWATIDADEVAEKAIEKGFLIMHGDYTNYNPDITADLTRLKAGGVPTYLFIDSLGKEHMIHSAYGETVIMNKMEELK